VLSIIVPAHNEEALIGSTLTAIKAAATAQQEPYEIIVVDDASTDRTGAIARSFGTRLIEVRNRQIAATRNAGAAAAAGDKFLFVDADTLVNARVVRAAVRALRRGAVGGGCRLRIEGRLPFYGKLIQLVLDPICRAIKLAGGCFFFCTREAFLAAGRFDESLFATEEAALGSKLKKLGRFVILPESVVTSGRKLRSHTAGEMLRICGRVLREGSGVLQKREGLELWYGPRRSE
jgi:glycosyltransferase involved in cell wall biosynthesis